ncbi:cation diffusion facilitator family transporter [Leptotrichia sp. HSP-536]|uniref:Cation diffusion facilitator family transporter n=1 Tax=Leptotrichia alba TaxID=3239304 RepID=A0AB39V680_9FUSO
MKNEKTKTIDFKYHHIKHYKYQAQSKKTLVTSILLTLFFALIELFGGIFSGSLALISDSFHMFSDVVALLFSIIAVFFSAKKPNKNFTYGFLRIEIISAFINGLALMIISVGIVIEAIKRLFNPEHVDFFTMFTIAVIGLLVNIILMAVLIKSLKKEKNLNVKSALWHFLGDTLNSVGVIIAAIILKLTNLVIFDIIISIIISIVIFIGGFKIAKEAFFILMEAVPSDLDIDEIHAKILTISKIKDIHEFHLWNISEENISISFHILLNEYDGVNDYEIVNDVVKLLKNEYGIEHVTVQIENPEINPHL